MWWCGLCRRWLRYAFSRVTTRGAAGGGRVGMWFYWWCEESFVSSSKSTDFYDVVRFIFQAVFLFLYHDAMYFVILLCCIHTLVIFFTYDICMYDLWMLYQKWRNKTVKWNHVFHFHRNEVLESTSLAQKWNHMKFRFLLFWFQYFNEVKIHLSWHVQNFGLIGSVFLSKSCWYF